MKSLFSLLIAILLLITTIIPVQGADYTDIVMDYLMDRYDVEEEDIELFEGFPTELEFTQKSFWYVSYMITGVEESIPDSSEEEKANPDRKMVDDGSTTILPAGGGVDDYPGDDGSIYGGIYIDMDTEEILNQTQMAEYFEAEMEIAQKEWERLSKEAGKLDVYLYQRLKDLSSSDKIDVIIYPVALETEEAQELFAELKEKYPEYTADMELEDVIFPLYGARILPTELRMDLAISNEASPELMESIERDINEVDILPIIEEDEEERQKYMEFWEETEKIRFESIIPSMETIRENLDDRDISYSDEETYLTAELTVEQINEIIEMEAVLTMEENLVFTTMDMDGDMVMAETTSADASDSVRTLSSQEEDRGITPYIVAGIVIVLVLALGTIIYFKKTKKQST